MTFEQLKNQKKLILLDCISGSTAYNLNVKGSDVDKKGVFVMPQEQLYGFNKQEQIANASNDEVYFEVGRFLELLTKNNPNILELLATPREFILFRHPIMDLIRPEDFLSKLCLDTFAGYAQTQIKKARGLNKKINKPLDAERKSVLDFCYVIHGNGSVSLAEWLKENNYKQEECGLTSVDHFRSTYLVYHQKQLSGGAYFRGIVSGPEADDVQLSQVAQFSGPVKMYIDGSGTGYVTEYGTNRVRKIVLTGYTLKGTLPAGLAFDPTTGIISGTPTGTITTVTDTITAFNASGYSTAMVAFTPGGPSAMPTPHTNYTITYLPRIPITDTSALYNQPVINENQTIQYFDGLGRAMQSVQAQASPSQKDFIMPYAYDNMGRAVKAYLPYSDQSTSTSTSGSFRTTAFTDAVNFYNPASPGAAKIPTDTAPYAQTVYEASPLGRVNEQGGIGATFQPGTGHTITTGYHVNVSADNISYYAINQGVPATISSFNPQVLTKAIVTDQNGHRQALWKDLQGKTITWSQLDAPTSYYSTDYIYNDLDELINIVPPSGKKQLASVGSPPIAQTLALQCYTFHYDSIGRVVEKKIPGKGWIYIVYNRGNRPVLNQDSNMRVKNQWLYVKYDAEGRVVQTGIYTNTTTTSRNAMQYLCDNSFPVLWETWQPGLGYTNNAFPQQSAIPSSSPLVVHTLYYYDDYSFPEVASKPFQANTYNTVATSRTMGILTGTSVYVLGTANQRIVTVNYYDNRNRLIQQISDNHLGQVDVINTQYDFVGEVTGSQRTTVPIAGSPLIVKDRYVYDQVSRLMDTYESLNGSTEIDISHNVYNEIDQKVSEGLHSINYKGPGSTSYTFAQTQEFRYSIRGQLTNINNGTLTNDGISQSDSTALFGESITYSEASPLGAIPQYNGNISGITWRNKIEQTGLPGLTTGGQGYAFHYDNVDRLTQSDYYTQSGSSFSLNTTGALTEKIGGYDEMGNIDTLLRKDKSGNLINKLTYTYQSNNNQLISVSDAGSQNISGTFTYDGNGNMISDSRKGITISYNFLDLPDTVKLGNSKLVFTYDAAGNKLYKQLITGGNVVSQRHYIEDAELTATSSVSLDGQVESIAMDEGRIVNTGGGNYQWEYYLQDHLYTNRVTFRPNSDGSLNLSSVQNYYPFGGDMGDATMNYSGTPHNYYKYNGNELQPELSLNTYDFGARHYDPVLGRWTAIDLLTEQSPELSPYNYVENNPMNLIDPGGLQPNAGSTYQYGFPIGSGSSAGTFGTVAGSGAAGLNLAVQGVKAWNAFSFKSPTFQNWTYSLSHIQQNRYVSAVVSVVNDFAGGMVNAYASDVTGTNAPSSLHSSAKIYNLGRKAV